MLDRESLQEHCEALLQQRLFLQQMKLTKLSQLKKHDGRVVDSLRLLKRFLPLKKPSVSLSLVFASSDEWLHIASENEESIDQDFLIYLAELSVALSVNSGKKLVDALILSDSISATRVGFELALRCNVEVSQDVYYQLDAEHLHNYLMFLGKSAKVGQLSFLNDLISNLNVEHTLKNTARLSRLLLGYDENASNLVVQLIEHDQLTDESLAVLLAFITENEFQSLIKDLSNRSDIETSLVISALTHSASPQYIPFLAEFLSSESMRESVLEGFAVQLGDDQSALLPYELFHPLREVAWSSVDSEQLEKDILAWFHSASNSWPSKMLAGEERSLLNIENTWLTGNSIQRKHASFCLATENPHTPLRSEISLWGGISA
ncbi:hypothetical protein [Litoribacillus peritrichatus]|uniref:Uncharacterized protein n=1 Tax=Litoribacillus peritrichatus TaxID=718191 RepID=A0ABP7M9X8_9GAMM